MNEPNPPLRKGRPKNEAAKIEAKEFGARLEAARTAAGEPTYATLAYEASMVLERPIVGQTIAEYHKGNVTIDGMRLAVIAFLAERYGVETHDLNPRLPRLIGAERGVLLRSRWSATAVATPPNMQGALALDFPAAPFTRPAAVPAPVVVCRCGHIHNLRADAVPCTYCAAPTFDEHRVCAQCRDLEVLERHASDVIDLVGLHARAV